MTLYESLVSNIGLGIEKVNSEYAKEICINKAQGLFERFLDYIGITYTNWVCEYMNKESGEDFTFTFYDNKVIFIAFKVYMWKFICYRTVVYKGIPYGKKYSVRGTGHISICELNEKGFRILDNVPELKNTYKRLDQLFKKYDKDERQWKDTHGTLPMRVYYWKDSKFSLKEIVKHIP